MSEFHPSISGLFKDCLQRIELQYENNVELQNTYSELDFISRIDYHKKSQTEIEQIFHTNLEKGMNKTDALIKYYSQGKNKMRMKQKRWWEIVLTILRLVCHPYVVVCFGVGLALLVFRILDSYGGEVIGNDMSYFVAAAMMTNAVFFVGYRIIIKILKRKRLSIPEKTKVKVKRNGVQVFIDSRKIVEGDIVEIQSGDKIQADIRIIQINSFQGLKFDRSSNGRLGQFYAVTKISNTQNILKADNMIFFPAKCTKGKGKGVVVATGKRTILSRLIKQAQTNKTILTQNTSKIINQIDRFMLITSISAIIITAVYTTLRCMDNFSNIQWLGNTVYISGVVMSFIPLTLPYQVFFILCIFMFITYKKGIIFKHLFSIEKFKDINCLCIDNNAVVINDASKVQQLWYDGQLSQNKVFENTKSFQELKKCVFLTCNKTKKQQLKTILEHFQKISGEIGDNYQFTFPLSMRQNNLQAKFNSFNTTNWYKATVHDDLSKNQGKYLFVTGCAQTVLNKCQYVFHKGNSNILTSTIRNSINQLISKQQQKGYKVIGFARYQLPQTKKLDSQNINLVKTQLVFIGFVCVSTNIHPEASKIISKIKKSGIQVIMLTNDKYRITCWMSQKLGLISKQRSSQLLEKQKIDLSEHLEARDHVISSRELKQKSQNLNQNPNEPININRWFSKIYKDQLVFSELNDAQRNKVISLIKANKRNICYFTNDEKALASLKNIQTIITCNISSNLLKRQADVIIKNNNFYEVYQILKLSRKAFYNVKKSVVYSLSLQPAKIVAVSAILIFKQTYIPISSIFLILEFVVNLIPAMCFAFEPQQQKYIQQSSTKNQLKLINIPVILQSYGYIGITIAIAAVFSYIVTLNEYGIDTYTTMTQGLERMLNYTMHYWQSFIPVQSFHNESYSCKVIRQSRYITNGYVAFQQICASYEAIRYATMSYFGAVLICQLFNIIICQTQHKSIFSRKWNNCALIFAAIIVIQLGMGIGYFGTFNKIFMTRDNNFNHLGVCSTIFGVFTILVDQIKKACVRKYGKDHYIKKKMLIQAIQW